MTMPATTAILGLLTGATLLAGIGRASAQEAAQFPGAAYPILGVMLGDTVDQAETKFEGGFELAESTWHFEVRKPSTGASFSLDFPAGLKGGTFAGIGMMTVGPQPATDGMEIRLATPESGSRVVAITRTLSTATGDDVPIAAFLQSLKAKYGEPSFEDDGQIAWLHDGTGKKVQVAGFEIGTSRVVENRLETQDGGMPTCWRQLSGAEYGSIRPLPEPYSYQSRRTDTQNCGGGLYVRYASSDRLLKTAQFLALDNRLLVADRAAMDARVLREIEAGPKAPVGLPPKL